MVAYPQEKKTPFAQLLRRYRIRAGMTQRSLAEKIENHISRPGGLTEKGIQALENGIRKIPHRDTVEKLAEALGLTDDERAEFRREADKLRVKRKASDEHDLTETLPSPTGDASQYLPRPSPADAIAPEAVEQAADESSFPPLPEHFVGREIIQCGGQETHGGTGQHCNVGHPGRRRLLQYLRAISALAERVDHA